ncbi:MAG: DUF2599 domain-containing protein [Mycobacterium sp.]|uniref:DUF2599 domain-containing protein n=1 Tax=Mycobacterium sp. TaxID=1785 RepID=UPI00261351E8|nr:DUF2599 domain-containing protein [Mycobacterium sp.]MDI3312834.1 DUF2599 domain-containing protein [Mycobacterium sp.]
MRRSRRALVLMPLGAITAALAVAVASADPGAEESTTPSPPFVDHVEWVHSGRSASLRVYPTPAGRTAARQPGTAAEADEAWAEVLTVAPDAGTPGMREQFICHWQLAELVQPGKSSWNLEPWRPVVDDAAMIASGCNPGGGPEPFS